MNLMKYNSKNTIHDTYRPLHVSALECHLQGVCVHEGSEVLHKICKRSKNKAPSNCKDTKENLYKTNATLWFNKVGKTEQLSPKYIKFALLDLMICIHRNPEDGPSVPKHVGVGTNHEMYFMILYFTVFY